MALLVSLIIGSNKKIRVVATISNNEPSYLLKDLEVEENMKATSRIATVLDRFAKELVCYCLCHLDLLLTCLPFILFTIFSLVPGV
jgi:hypothetical protein